MAFFPFDLCQKENYITFGLLHQICWDCVLETAPVCMALGRAPEKPYLIITTPAYERLTQIRPV